MKNWKTSFIGSALILAGIYTGITAKTSWTEASIIITMGTGFLFSKDFDKTGTK